MKNNSKTEYKYGFLKPGEFKDLVFSFYTNRECLVALMIGPA